MATGTGTDINRHRKSFWTTYMDKHGREIHIRDMSTPDIYDAIIIIIRHQRERTRVYHGLLKEYRRRQTSRL